MLIDISPLRRHRDFRLLFIGQLIPVLIFGLLGGAYADRINRRRLMLVCESAMAVIVGLLLLFWIPGGAVSRAVAAVGRCAHDRPTPWLTVLCLVLAGGADMVSGLFRGIIWNHAVPNAMRGRLAGIAMISYMSGPLLGNTRAGWVASLTTVSVSLWTGGAACIVAVVATSLALPRFWAYASD